MKQTYEYMHVVTAMDSICIEDIGNCNIISSNDDGYCWLLSTSTSLGQVLILECGPFDVETKEPDETSFLYKSSVNEYNEKRIDRRIDNFINEPKRFITQVVLVEREDVEEYLQKFQSKIL